MRLRKISISSRSVPVEVSNKAITRGDKDACEADKAHSLGIHSSSEVSAMLLAINLCHSCVPMEDAAGITYQGNSPDEIALLNGSENFGVRLFKRNAESIVLDLKARSLQGVHQSYEVLGTIDFTAARQKMTVVVRMPSGRILATCKGADIAVRETLKKLDPCGNDLLTQCQDHVDEFARHGLRTMMYASRYLEQTQYERWKYSYDEALASSNDQDARLERAISNLEQGMELLGAVGIEDELQDGVPEAIDKLRRAGLKICMITGDKKETAISIGRAARLVRRDTSPIVLGSGGESTDTSIRTVLQNMPQNDLSATSIVFDGAELESIVSQEQSRQPFLDLLRSCESTICCRATPGQKALLVRMVRRNVPNSVTLAIGDGANDIAMIQEANIGIGIQGREGLQAARVADYSFAQFHYLTQLLLVHGRWNYIRTCKYILGTFYKETLLYVTQACYQHWNNYTGISLYEPTALTLFQVLFSSLPVIFLGIWEKDLTPETLLAVPELYKLGRRDDCFNARVFLGWVLMATIDAVIAFFVMLKLYGQSNSGHEDEQELYAMGTLTYSACVVIISLKLQVLELHNKTRTAAIAILYSVGIWCVFNLILSTTYSDNTIYDVEGGLLYRFGRDPLWWLALLASVVSVLAFELAVASIRTYLWPTEVDIWRQIEKIPEYKQRLQEVALADLGPAKLTMLATP
jgi:phospholipid-translocating ATPase